MRMAQIGIAKCGCVVAAHVEWSEEFAKRGIRISEKEYSKGVRQSIREWMKSGLSIGRVDMDSVETVFTECADANCEYHAKNAKQEEHSLFEEQHP